MTRPWKIWRLDFTPGAKDIAIFLGSSALMALRVPMPVEATSNFTYSHPWLSLITLFPVLAWLTGAYVLGAIRFVILITRFIKMVLRRQAAKAIVEEHRTHDSQ